jgi:hypothetical protein
MTATPAVDAESGDATEPCAVPDCGAPSIRALARGEARKAFPAISEQGRRAPLCRAHYKEWKKATKLARKLDRLAW